MRIIVSNLDRIIEICKLHKVSKLFVFGSVLSPNFSKNSDIDFLVSFENVSLADYADNYFQLKSSFEKLFNRSIDLLEDSALKNPYLRKSIDSEKKIIYGS